MNSSSSTPTQMFPLDGGSTPVTAEPMANDDVSAQAYEVGNGLVSSLSNANDATLNLTQARKLDIGQEDNLDLGQEDTLDDKLDITPTFTPNFR